MTSNPPKDQSKEDSTLDRLDMILEMFWDDAKKDQPRKYPNWKPDRAKKAKRAIKNYCQEQVIAELERLYWEDLHATRPTYNDGKPYKISLGEEGEYIYEIIKDRIKELRNDKLNK